MSDQDAQIIAAAIRSVGLANALSWVAVAMLLDEKGVMPSEKFAEMASKLAEMIEVKNPDEIEAGAHMLREVHDILRRQNPPKWKPTVVGGDAA